MDWPRSLGGMRRYIVARVAPVSARQHAILVTADRLGNCRAFDAIISPLASFADKIRFRVAVSVSDRRRVDDTRLSCAPRGDWQEEAR